MAGFTKGEMGSLGAMVVTMLAEGAVMEEEVEETDNKAFKPDELV